MGVLKHPKHPLGTPLLATCNINQRKTYNYIYLCLKTFDISQRNPFFCTEQIPLKLLQQLFHQLIFAQIGSRSDIVSVTVPTNTHWTHSTKSSLGTWKSKLHWPFSVLSFASPPSFLQNLRCQIFFQKWTCSIILNQCIELGVIEFIGLIKKGWAVAKAEVTCALAKGQTKWLNIQADVQHEV